MLGGGKVHIWGSKNNLCRSLELSQASEAQPENLLPSVLGSAVIQMLQDPALCLTEREFWPWGDWEGTEPPNLLPPPALQTPTHNSNSSSSSCATPRAPTAPSSCSWAGKGWQAWRCFPQSRTPPRFHQVFPQTPPAASQALTELRVLKSDANLSTAEIFDRYKPLFFPRHNCNLRNALV